MSKTLQEVTVLSSKLTAVSMQRAATWDDLWQDAQGWLLRSSSEGENACISCLSTYHLPKSALSSNMVHER
jgi:hypothetical protein